jgi:hypothetical protein
MTLETPNEIREDEREQCCKDICGHCDDGNLPIREEYETPRFITFDSCGDLMSYCWRHREAELEGRIYGCDASNIRERAYQQEQEDRFNKEIGATGWSPSPHQQEQEEK